MKGRCRYAKNASDDRQFLSSRRHRHRLKIQFEKSNNTAQFARKCISRSSSDGIVRRVDTMRPIGGTTPDFYSVRRSRLFSITAVHYRRRGNPSICSYFLSSCNSFFHRRRFGCTRARYNRRRVTACPICIPRSKSGRPRRFPVCHWYLFSRSPHVFSRPPHRRWILSANLYLARRRFPRTYLDSVISTGSDRFGFKESAEEV